MCLNNSWSRKFLNFPLGMLGLDVISRNIVVCLILYFAWEIYSSLLTYLLTPWSRVHLQMLTGSQLITKSLACYGTWRFITAFTRACVNISYRDVFLLWVVSILPKLQAGGPPRFGCPLLCIQYIRSHPPYWRPFLHPQPEDAPYRGDRDPLKHGFIYIYIYIFM